MNKEQFSYDDGVICKRCNRLFHFGQVCNLIDGLTFPNGDFSLIKAKCPKCFSIIRYPYKDVKKSGSNEDKDELVKELRNEISQLKSDNEILKNKFEELLKNYTNVVSQISKADADKKHNAMDQAFL